MNLEKFIEKEILLMFTSEIKSVFDEETSAKYINELNSTELFSSKGENKEVTELEYLEFLPKLKNVGFILDLFKKMNNDEYESINISLVNQMLAKNKNNGLLALLWVKYKAKQFSEDEYFDIELADFYREVFEKYDYLMNLDDFLYMLNWSFYKPYNKKWEESIFAPVYEYGIKKYPKKYGLHRHLAMIYFMNEQYQKVLDLTNAVLPTFNVDLYAFDREFPYSDYLEFMQFRAQANYKLGEFDKAMTDCNYILNNLPTISFAEGEDRPLISDYLDAFLIRMSIHLKFKNYKALNSDFITLHADNYVFNSWRDEFGELSEYIEFIELFEYLDANKAAIYKENRQNESNFKNSSLVVGGLSVSPPKIKKG